MLQFKRRHRALAKQRSACELPDFVEKSVIVAALPLQCIGQTYDADFYLPDLNFVDRSAAMIK